MIDEADRILEIGFEEEMAQIIKILPKERQTMLFSATQTTKVSDLARISLKKGPLYINVDERKDTSTAEGLEQGYVVCESDKRFLLLFTFLRKNLKKKVIVFFSSCNSVKYHAELMNYIDVPVLELHVSAQKPESIHNGCTNSSSLCMCRGSKSNKSEPRRFSNSVMRTRGSYCVRMWRPVVWTFPLWTGLCNSTLPMILATISTVWVEQHVAAAKAKVSSSSFLANLASCDTSSMPVCL